MKPRLTRRALLGTGLGASIALLDGAVSAHARLPYGGRVALHLPWPLATIDPHRIDDGTAALLGGTLFDTLYAYDDAGKVVPSLAERDPVFDGSTVRIALRGGLKTAMGRAIEAHDVAFSIARARTAGAHAWLAELPSLKLDGPHALVFASTDPASLAHALASPLVAIVPAGFSPERPDGTGPCRADREGDALVLRRNPNAANGPSYLDEVVVRPAPDLSSSLRAFEAGTDDVGWLGSGLHEPRPGAATFDAGMVAWAVVRTGNEARTWDVPGVAQRVADRILPARLAYLGVGPSWSKDAEDGWGGPPCDLLVRDDAVWLGELARAVAASLTRPSHEITVKPVPSSELVQRRASRSFALALDVVRPLSPGTLGALIALATADNSGAAVDLVRHPPRFGEILPRKLTNTMRLGIIGEVRAQGGRAQEITLPNAPNAGIDFGASTRAIGPP